MNKKGVESYKTTKTDVADSLGIRLKGATPIAHKSLLKRLEGMNKIRRET